MKLLKKFAAAAVCMAMLLVTGTTSLAGVVGKSSSRYPKVIQGGEGTYLNGAEIHMLSSATNSQMMSFVIKTKNGKLIVIDGGLAADAAHLSETIKSYGGEVSAWVLSHPHSDHVEAFNRIVNEGFDGIKINAVYYNIREQEWYDKYESHRAGMVAQFRDAIGKLPDGVSHITNKGEVYTVDDVTIHILNNPYWIETNSINNSSLAFRLDFGTARALFLGDMGYEAGEALKAEVPASELKSDIVQMAHHGQYGVGKEVYQIIQPKVCMWNAPGWLWDNDGGSGYNTGNYKTLEVRGWMDELGVKSNYCIKDGDQTIK